MVILHEPNTTPVVLPQDPSKFLQLPQYLRLMLSSLPRFSCSYCGITVILISMQLSSMCTGYGSAQDALAPNHMLKHTVVRNDSNDTYILFSNCTFFAIISI